VTAVEAAFREHRGPLLATLVAELRSFDLAEDALQDAFAAATRQWPGEGVPRRPAAWLLSVARRRAVDRRRRDETLRRY
jgi:RNA polymerase sigma-70 factor, ECF subfamily